MTQTVKVKVEQTITVRIDVPILAGIASMSAHELADWMHQHLSTEVTDDVPLPLMCLAAMDVPEGVPFRKPTGAAVFRRLEGLPMLFPAHAPGVEHIQVVGSDYRLGYVKATKIVVIQAEDLNDLAWGLFCDLTCTQ